MKFQTPDDAYLVLLGTDGTIRWTFHGPTPDDASLRQLHDQVK